MLMINIDFELLQIMYMAQRWFLFPPISKLAGDKQITFIHSSTVTALSGKL